MIVNKNKKINFEEKYISLGDKIRFLQYFDLINLQKAAKIGNIQPSKIRTRKDVIRSIIMFDLNSKFLICKTIFNNLSEYLKEKADVVHILDDGELRKLHELDEKKAEEWEQIKNELTKKINNTLGKEKKKNSILLPSNKIEAETSQSLIENKSNVVAIKPITNPILFEEVIHHDGSTKEIEIKAIEIGDSNFKFFLEQKEIDEINRKLDEILKESAMNRKKDENLPTKCNHCCLDKYLLNQQQAYLDLIAKTKKEALNEIEKEHSRLLNETKRIAEENHELALENSFIKKYHFITNNDSEEYFKDVLRISKLVASSSSRYRKVKPLSINKKCYCSNEKD